MTATIHVGDVREVLPALPDASVDAVVTDPPYELGFMGRGWDRAGVAFDLAVWREIGRVAKPGAHLLAFGGTRTHHRLMCAIEDAGWEIRDCLMWLYGQGYPKSHNLDGDWRGWGTALKPAWEPVVLARNPLAERTIAANVGHWGTGALNIDGCRIGAGEGGTRDGEATATQRYTHRGATTFALTPGPRGGDAAGRWPANVVMDEASAELLDEQSGITASGGYPPEGTLRTRQATYGEPNVRGEPRFGRSTGGASRFLYVAKATTEERNRGLAGMPERTPHPDEPNGRAWDIPGSQSTPRANHHPTVKPVALMRWLCRLVTPPGGVVLDPFLGSGTTAIAALAEGFGCIGIERDPEYVEIARRRVIGDAPLLNRVEVLQ